MISLSSVDSRLLMAGLVMLLVAIVACGSSEPAAPLERVVETGDVFDIGDLEAAGMKASKQYDVADLPFGEDAWYGFIRTESGPLDVEVRFYASHLDAVEFGTEFAENVSGEDADIEEDTTIWPEGYKDRQRMRSGGTADLAAWSGQRGPNYADFVIYGNMVLLCQGDEPEESIETCYELISAVLGDEG